jgi:thymidylate synthase ThyX
MKEMKERTALGEAILKHWREHCPQMVRDLEKENRLDQAVFETQERTGDLLYELVSVKKMDYHAAWELAAQEWALPQSEDLPSATKPPSGTSRSGKSRPGKSKSATSSRNRLRGRRRGTSG